ncbi:unnamed protein product [Peniophora sp. CBMAI 1063]|nr:unnamed protein product [Peniophora sp. CBMAI 1063]
MSPDALPGLSIAFHALSDAQWNLYMTTRNPADLDATIDTTQTAIDLAVELGPSSAELLFDLGRRLRTRFVLNNSYDELDRAVAALRDAVTYTADGDPEQPLRLTFLGNRLHERYKRLGRLEDLDDAVTMFCLAVEGTQDGDPNKLVALSNYGASLHERFERIDDPEDITCSIGVLKMAVECSLDRDPDKPSRLNNLGNSYARCFERNGNLGDLEQAIWAHHSAVQLTPDGHSDKPSRLNNLGNSLLTRFEQTGRVEDLEQAVVAQRNAVELTPDGHPDKPSQLNNLGNSLLTRFEQTGRVEDLEQAIVVQRNAVKLTPAGHPDKPSQLSNLGNSLLRRSEQTGRLDDLEQAIVAQRNAIELTPDGHPDKPSRLNNLGTSLLTRFEQTGSVEDLERAIVAQLSAVELTPDGHPDKPSRLSNLGGSLTRRFERTGELQDLEQAIVALRRAVELTPEGHPDKPSQLNNLGTSLTRRFERTGELRDLEQAIVARRRAIELTPEGHPDKPSRLSNLGNSLSRLFEKLEERGSLEESIACYEKAIELTADDHPQKLSHLVHLGQKLRTRFEFLHNPADLATAISAIEHAIELQPHEHPDLYHAYDSLAACLSRRFDHFKDVSDIEKAVALASKVANLLPKDDPELAATLINLGLMQERQFNRSLSRSDFDAAIESFKRATLHTHGTPSVRFKAALNHVDMVSRHLTFSTVESLLTAHSQVIDILPEVMWLGHDIQRRFEESSRLGRLVSTAVSVAISADALRRAVEWLEAGRAIIWAQISSLRTPLDELQAAFPDLAESLRGIQTRLQRSVHGTFAHDVRTFGDIPGMTINPAADDHRQAAIDYDSGLKRIRASPGFEDFLLPKKYDALVLPSELQSGPIVFINVHPDRCDAIVLAGGGAPTVVPLPDLTSDRAHLMLVNWKKGLADHGIRETGIVQDEPPESDLGGMPSTEPTSHRSSAWADDDYDICAHVLECAWEWIVGPILRSLDLASLEHDDIMPHITWCATGPLTQVPLHAAGKYSDPTGPRAFNLVVSSYTPSLTALKRCAEGAGKHLNRPSLLLVTQPNTPGLSRLPGTEAEARVLRGALEDERIESSALDHASATVTAVRDGMKQHTWVHLACHGSQNRKDATQSAFHLYRGRLTLAALMGTVADKAELAFLSACQTASGDINTPEESAHLAAGMLAVGYKGVVATMWSIMDQDAPVVVKAYYKRLLAVRGSGKLGKGETGAAYALHEATKALREKVGEDKFTRWVPFVHFGV